MLKERSSGILLHISSLPSDYGIGDLGPKAYEFVDFLSDSGQSIWQILPLNPTISACGHSPYSSISAFAANTLFISPQKLVEDGLLKKTDLNKKPSFHQNACDFDKAITFRSGLFNKAYESFKSDNIKRREFDSFCFQHKSWLDNFSLFKVIREINRQRPWSDWQPDLRNREDQALERIESEHNFEIEKVKFLQFLFFKQWFQLKQYCNSKGVKLLGDIPIYVSYDSADVWKNHDIFKLNKDKELKFVAGVPPDYFSKTGQLWGNPVYDWDALKKTNFKWWVARVKHNLSLFDLVRIDHFRGLVAFWQVPRGEATAIRGEWKKVPVKDLFNTLFEHFKDLPIIAEDLGIITDDVRQELARLGFPGMKVLMFAFGEENPMHPYLPHTYQENCLVYTGTHDNNTFLGWFANDAREDEKKRLIRYIGHTTEQSNLHWEMIRIAMDSKAFMSIFPLQDILGLGARARMNVPSKPKGNWAWRFTKDELTPEVRVKLRDLTEKYKRS